MGQIIAGIDEAGRGPVIGPLVIAMFSCPIETEKAINALCKKDSKQLTRAQREAIFEKLRWMGKAEYAEISAQTLNSEMDEHTLNEIEAMNMAKLAKLAGPGASVKIDLPDRYAWVFAKRMSKYGVSKYEAEHKADENHPIVAAASICAKVVRDRRIDEIKEIIGDFGSGYPSDEKTREFLRKNAKNPQAMKFIRKKWKTLQTIRQMRLGSFGD
jgi:ribonuclease HII